MANDVEQLDLSNVDKDNLIDEVSEFDRLVLTDTDRLYGIEGDKRKPVTKLGHVVLEALSIATGSEVERLAPPAGAGRQRERGQGGRDIEARIQRAVTEAVRQALDGTQEREQHLQEEIERLRQEIERLQKPLHERLDEAFGDNWVPRQEGIAVARRGNDGFMEDGWTTDSQPYEKEGKWYIRIKKDNNEEEAELASLSRVPETPPPADEAAQRQQQRDELETRIAGYEGVNLDNLYQTYRGHLQNAANTDEREAFANDATREAAMAQIRSQEVRDYVNSMNQQQRDALPANAIRDLTAWIEVRDAQEPDITPEGQPAPTAPANGQPVMRRRSFASRTWARLRGRPDQEYAPTGEMVDENGRHYRIVEEEIVYTDPENNRGMAAALLALGAAAVSGLVVYELTKGGGHVDSHQLNQILAQDKGLRHQVHDLSNQVSSFEKKNTLQHAHAHKHELQADQGLHNQIHRAAKHQDRLMNDLKGQITRGDRSQARSLKDIHDHLQDSGAYWGVRYPWDWAANKIGTLRAEGWLHKLAAKAAAHGHKVKWIMNRNGTESLKVDGSENTQKVLQIISQYK